LFCLLLTLFLRLLIFTIINPGLPLKTIHLLVLQAFSLIFSLVCIGQNDSVHIKLYDSWFDFKPTKERQRVGYVYEFADTSITVVAKEKYRSGLVPGSDDLHLILAEDVNKMLFRRKGQKKIAIATGLGGAMIGCIYGATRGGETVTDSYGYEMFYISAGFKAFWWGLVGGGIGIAVGLPLGAAKKKFIINGDIGHYRQIQPDLLKYSIRSYVH